MKYIVDVDDYKIKSCKRKVQEKYASWYDEMVANGIPLEEELEKIKAEIEEKQEEVIGINQKANFQYENDYGMYYGYESSIGIIEEHIKELKGENNDK